MLARHIQQEIKRVHEGLEMVGLLEGWTEPIRADGDQSQLLQDVVN